MSYSIQNRIINQTTVVQAESRRLLIERVKFDLGVFPLNGSIAGLLIFYLAKIHGGINYFSHDYALI